MNSNKICLSLKARINYICKIFNHSLIQSFIPFLEFPECPHLSTNILLAFSLHHPLQQPVCQQLPVIFDDDPLLVVGIADIRQLDVNGIDLGFP